MPEKLLIGHKLRRLRKEAGLSQAQMAEQLSISPSYLALIEHNQRPVTVALLMKLAQNFGIDLQRFAADDETRLIADMRDVLTDAVFQGIAPGATDLRDLAHAAPAFAEALIALYAAYRHARQELENLAASPTEFAQTAPIDAARAFFHAEVNYFPPLEDAADALWRTGGLEADALIPSLGRRLSEKHDLRVQFIPGEVMGNAIRRHDPHRRRVLVSEMLSPSSRAFQLACQIALLEQEDQIAAILDRVPDRGEARALVRIGLVDYFAGAVLMPYQKFFEAARASRHDFGVLTARFGVSFEQVCHRLTTLQRPNFKGAPFSFIRVDAAGNILKSFSANRLQFARFGGACPVWNVYRAFAAPGRLLTQLADLPDDVKYISLARTAPKGLPTGAGEEPQHAIALICEARFSDQIVYADTLGAVEPDHAGIACRSCPRAACNRRAYPAMHQTLPRSDLIRSSPIYSTAT